MFIVLLKFSQNKGSMGQHLAGHKTWLKEGFENGVFLLAGSIKPEGGGGIVAHNTSFEELRSFVNKDPFVAENVVQAEIIEIEPSRTDDRLDFLRR